MRNIAQTLRDHLKSSLKYLGLYDYVLKLRYLIDINGKKYRDIKIFTVTMNGKDVHFSTDDQYSNSWFFPRYAGGKVHEKKVTEMLIGSLDGAKCFVDVGTNLGWYTCLACKHMPQGVVYGFELDDFNFSLLKKNLAINSCSNAEVHNIAVSDSTGLVSYMRDSKRPSPCFVLHSDAMDHNRRGLVSVKATSLDDYLESKEFTPDVIKIDVEGAEMNVLRGMERIIKNVKPILFLEVHPNVLPSFNTSPSAIVALLIETGYQVFEIENMRAHDSTAQLKALAQDANLEKNTMLYAVAAK